MDKSKLLDKWLKQKSGETESIEKKPLNSPNQLSNGQRRLFFLQQTNLNSPFYNYPELYTIRGDWDIERFKRCIQKVAQCHEIFFHNFKLNREHEPEVFINRDRDPVLIEHFDLSDTPNGLSVEEFLRNKGRFVFDLSQDVLFRVTIISISDREYQVLFNLHHIITDKWSMRVFRDQLLEFYGDKSDKYASNFLSKKGCEYLDFSHHQNNKIIIPEEEIDYWKEKITSSIEELTLPTDKNPSKITHEGKFNSSTLPHGLSKKIVAYAKEQEITLFTFFLAAYNILLNRYSGTNTIRVGTPVSNRNRSEWEQLIGFFNETVVLQTHIEANKSFKQYLKHVKSEVLLAFDHKKVPYETIVSHLNSHRDAHNNPLFRTMFLFHQKKDEKQLLPGLQMEHQTFDIGVSKFDLTLYVEEENESLSLNFEYATDYFDEQTIVRMHDHFQTLLYNILEDTDQKIKDLNILTDIEIAQFEDWNLSDFKPKPVPIDEAFEEVVLELPDSVAVTDSNGEVTYQELNKRSNALANQLRTYSKASRRIGLFFGRKSEMITAILGTLKSGCSYVTLDPSLPSDRIQYLIEDAQLELIVTSSDLADELDVDIEKIEIEKIGTASSLILLKNHSVNDEAYVIYTSGSIGKPKGVSISHSNLFYSTFARPEFFNNNNPECFLLFSPFSFDSSVAGIFWTLLTGGRLLISKVRAEQDIHHVSELIYNQKVSHTLLLPSLYNVLLQEADSNLLKSLEIVMVAGEACPATTVQLHFNKLPYTKLYNEYGPTECTVWCIAHEVTMQDLAQRVPIGRPIPGSQAYILDPNNHRVPVGVTGELFVGGNGVSKGYIGNANSVNKPFIDNPFGKGKLYKTGDLASYRRNGTIDFKGRSDNQIKIRGHRIELSEIEQALMSLNYINRVSVIFDNEKERLLAFIKQDRNSDIQENQIKRDLKNILPQYMVPFRIFSMEDFPQLPNGKIDQNHLLSVSHHFQKTNNNSINTSLTPTEKVLVDIWKEILNQSDINLTDNFFELGGDSISSIRLVAKAKEKGINLSPTQIFETQTIGEISDFLDEKIKNENDFNYIVSLKATGNNPPLVCIHTGFLDVIIYKKLAETVGINFPVYAIQPKGIDGGEMHHSIEEMAQDYLDEILTLTDNKKFYLLGYCFSGVACLEIARIAKEKDIDVEIVIVDSANLPWWQLHKLLDNKVELILNLGKRVFRLGWQGIVRNIKRRFIDRVVEKFGGKVEGPSGEFLAVSKNDIDEYLWNVSLNLIRMNNKYHWKPVHVKTHLLRSSQHVNNPDRDIHVDVWEKLSLMNLSTYDINGNHSTIFEGNSVIEMAQIIEIIICHDTE